jgi:hypothetical protein
MDFLRLLSRMPAWIEEKIGDTLITFGLLLVGLGLILRATFDAGVVLPREGLERACWSGLQLLIGFAMFVTAQVSVLALVAPQNIGLGALDLLLPGRLWAAAIKQLPETRWQVIFGSWGAVLILCSVFWLQGLSYWPDKAREILGYPPAAPSQRSK